MHYFEPDVWYLIGKAPVLGLGRESSGLSLLRRARSALETYRKALAAYPRVRCEPLDFLYICLESLGALDSLLFEDLMTGCTWRAGSCGVRGWLRSLHSPSSWRPCLARDRAHRKTYGSSNSQSLRTSIGRQACIAKPPGASQPSGNRSPRLRDLKYHSGSPPIRTKSPGSNASAESCGATIAKVVLQRLPCIFQAPCWITTLRPTRSGGDAGMLTARKNDENRHRPRPRHG